MRTRVWIRRVVPWVVSFFTSAGAFSQGIQDTARSQTAGGLTLSAEAFCSPTKPRVSNVRLRWTLSPEALSASKLSRVADARHSLDTTIYANGFEKGLYVTLTLQPGAVVARPEAAITAVATQSPQLRQNLPRAFRIRLIEAGPNAAADTSTYRAVVEDVEPGVNYTWRLTIEAPAGKVVSAPVEVQAVACPVDFVEEESVPAKKPPAKPPAKRVPPRKRL
jgi:hypothetical protein